MTEKLSNKRHLNLVRMTGLDTMSCLSCKKRNKSNTTWI